MGGKKNPVFEENDDVISNHTQERSNNFNEDMPIVVKNIQSNYQTNDDSQIKSKVEYNFE
jgi:hypothetical protein